MEKENKYFVRRYSSWDYEKYKNLEDCINKISEFENAKLVSALIFYKYSI